MKRDENLISLSHDHHHGLRLAVALKRNTDPDTAAGRALSFWESDLNFHFAAEESVLYPAAVNRDASLDEMLHRMMEEHTQIRKYFDLLNQGIIVSDDLHRLGRLLEEHIRFEERDLFRKIESVLSEEELRALGGRLSGGMDGKRVD